MPGGNRKTHLESMRSGQGTACHVRGWWMGNYTFLRDGYRIRLFRSAFFVMVLLLAGPVYADTYLMPSAERATRILVVEEAGATFERATAAGAEYKAPYEYHMAREYLDLARQELKEGDKIGIHEFAARSEAFSNLALEKARGGAK